MLKLLSNKIIKTAILPAVCAGVFLFQASAYGSDPVSVNCEANLSPSQVGLVMVWNDYPSSVFGRKYRSGRYMIRYRKYSYPYLYGIKIGRENIFNPGKYSMFSAAVSGNYLLIEDTLITPSVSVGSEVYGAVNAGGDSVFEPEVNAYFSKEFSGIMPYIGPVIKFSRLSAGGTSEKKWALNFSTGLKFYTYPGVSYGLAYTFGRLGGWGLYFNDSW